MPSVRNSLNMPFYQYQKAYLGDSQTHCPFNETEFTLDDPEIFSVPLEQIIYIPSQEKFVNEHCQLSSKTKKHLRISNPELPLLLRLVLPKITTQKEFSML